MLKTNPCDTVEQLKLRVNYGNKSVIGPLIINSLPENFNQLELIIKYKTNILVITETKLDSNFPYSNL